MAIQSRLVPVKLVKAVEKFRVGLDLLRKKTFPPSMSLLEIITGHWLSQTVIVAAELEVADALSAGPLSIAELAKRTAAHEESLYRLMRVLVAVGIFSEPSPKVFANNDLSGPLSKTAPDSVHGFAVMNGRAFHWNAWGELLHSVRTGEAAVKRQQGVGLFDYLSKNPEDSRIFDNAMTSVATPAANAVAAGMNFSRFKTIVDVGGGHGNFLGAILRNNPSAKGILFDQAHVVEGAKQVLQGHGIASRCRIEAGSFFEAVPKGADAYLLKNIIHDWSDELSMKILSNIREAMDNDSRLFIVETVIPEGSGYHVGKMIDLEMLVCTPGGKERTLKEMEDLFARSSLKLVRVHPTMALESIVEVAAI